MRDALLVALGGGAGSVLRWAIASAMLRASREPAFPWGTLVVNLVGSLAIGAALGVAEARGGLASPVRVLLVTGLLGGFTTFSAFSGEVLLLLRTGQAWAASGYVLGSVLGGLALAALGWAAVTRLAA